MSDWPPPPGSGQPPPPPPNWGTPTGSGSGGSSPLGGSPPPPGGSPPPPAWGDQQPGWGGQQQPGWPGQPQPWQQQPPAGGGTNGAAIAALIVGILALLGGIIPFIGVVAGILLGLIALVLGIVGLRKARAPGVGTGRGMAITGIVLGILGLLFGIGQIVALIAGFSAFEDSGVLDDLRELREQIEQQGSATSVFDLAEGDCYDDPADSDAVARVPSVTCSQSHDNEVFAIIDYPAEGSDYPGLSEVTEYASEQCQGDLFSDFVGTDYLDSRYYVTTLYPTEETWAGGDREVVCALYDQDGQITGSVAGSEE